MDHFEYIQGRLHAEAVPVEDIAEAVGTPFYVYSTATLERHYHVFEEALSGLDHLIAYSLKANSNQAVIATLARLGAGADVVSGGELARALAAGVPPERVIFSGVGKTAEEMQAALAAGIRQFNVESDPELDLLDATARAMGEVAPVTVRVNPDVDARTHAKISTGKSENKFGVPISRAREIYARAAELGGIRVVGIDVHIGSQLTELAPFEAAFTKIADLAATLRSDGHEIRRLDLGGGLGIPYRRSNEAPPLPFDYGALIKRTVGHLGCEIAIEPGRLIAGNAGLMVASVLYAKQGEGRDFLILDAAMNDLIRPAMYDAWHDIVPVTEPAPDTPVFPTDVVGPVCETADTFARERPLPRLSPGALVAFRSAGAYGAAMASEYNSRPLIPEVLVSGERFALVRPRATYADMIGRDRLAPWLDGPDAESPDPEDPDAA